MGKRNKEADKLINTLKRNRFYAECPCGCGDTFLLREADLFYLDNFNEQAREVYNQRIADVKERRLNLRKSRTNMLERLKQMHRPKYIGSISEKIAPCLPGFRHDHADCRPLGDPIDYVVFEGISKKGSVSRIIFTEIKTGNARLTSREKEIKSLIEANKVSFDTYEGGNK